MTPIPIKLSVSWLIIGLVLAGLTSLTQAQEPSTRPPLALPQAEILLDEDFSTAVERTPPAGWSNNTLAGDDYYDVWRFDNPNGYSLDLPVMLPIAIFNDYSFSNAAPNAALESPVIDATGKPYLLLRFDQQLYSPSGTGWVEVYDGNSWQSVYSATIDVDGPTTLDISPQAGNVASAQIRFRFQSDNTDNGWWIVDNVQVLAFDKPAVELALTTQAPGQVYLNQPYEYTLSLNNHGDNPADNLIITNTLPAEVTYSHSAAECQYQADTHTVICSWPTLNSAQTVTATIGVVAPAEVGVMINQAVARADNYDLQPDNNQTFASTGITGPHTVFFEDFATASGETPPTGWSNTINPTSDTPNYTPWCFGSDACATSPIVESGLLPLVAPMAVSGQYKYGVIIPIAPDELLLTSPNIDTTGLTSLLFEYDAISLVGADPNFVHQLEFFDGATWQTIDNLSEMYAGRRSVHIPIESDSPEAKLRFNFASANTVLLVDNLHLQAFDDTAVDIQLIGAPPEKAALGEQRSWPVQVKNAGAVEASNVVLTGTLSASNPQQNVSATQGSCNLNGATFTCNLGTLAPDAIVTANIALTAPLQAEVVVHSLKVAASQADFLPANNTLSQQISVENPPATRYVDPSGTDDSACSQAQTPCQTLTYAVQQAAEGDTIELAAGLYQANLQIDKALTLSGENTESTIISGNKTGRILHSTEALTLSTLTLTEGRGQGPGGALYSTADVLLYEVNFIDNQSSFASYFRQAHGGAVAVDGNLVIWGGRFENNHCTEQNNITTPCNGGAVMVDQHGTISGTTFISNTAMAKGGGIVAEEGRLIITNSVFMGNRTMPGESRNGGAVYAFQGGLEVYGSQFEGNYSGFCGGAIYATTLPLLIENSLFADNISESYGGGIYAGDLPGLEPMVVVTNSQFLRNQTKDNFGGGLHLASNVDEAVISHSEFRHNRGDERGGGLSSNALNLTINQTQFFNNRSTGGGGLYAQNGTLDIVASHFENNDGFYGGGARVEGPTFISATRFISNTAYGGGAIYADKAPLTVTHSIFTKNNARSEGGAVIINGEPALVVNSLFVSNWSKRGQVFNVSHDPLELVHNTIVFTATDLFASAEFSPTSPVILLDSGMAYITNTIISGYERMVADAESSFDKGIFEETHNLFYQNTDGVGGSTSLTGNPHFVDPTQGNYRLLAHSPAIDSGLNTGLSTDFYGSPRPQGAGVDRGYYESPRVYRVITTTLGNGSIDLDPAGGGYDYGRIVTATATPATGWQFDGWNTPLSGTVSLNQISLLMTTDHTITATFSEIITQTPGISYSLTTAVIGSGTISPTGGMYPSGTEVNLVATPDSGWQFDSWRGDISGTVNLNTLRVLMDADKAITATFSPVDTSVSLYLPLVLR